MTPTQELVERLRAKHDDTWPIQIGYGEPINQDGPEAASRLELLQQEVDRHVGAGKINWYDLAAGLQLIHSSHNG